MANIRLFSQVFIGLVVYFMLLVINPSNARHWDGRHKPKENNHLL